jgi:5-aminolevulinate synthase
VIAYKNFFENALSSLKEEGKYRYFNKIVRERGNFPYAIHYKGDQKNQITVWCSNDYLNMGENPSVIQAMIQAIEQAGTGAGGTRNISGSTYYHDLLERELADLHNKEAALVFTSGYVANEAALSTLAGKLPGCVVFSDEKNHASMIQGIRFSKAEKRIFRHNDSQHLEMLLKQFPKEQPKIIAFESVYSMDGDKAPLKRFIELAKEYNALTYLDEVHAVGLYGEQGGGIAQKLGLEKEVDIIQGTLGKAFGIIGGYIAASSAIVDFVRSFASSFIFTTALPPAIVAGALESVRYLRSHKGIRPVLQERVSYIKQKLDEANFFYFNSITHIIPLLIGEAHLCKAFSDRLLNVHHIYSQAINYPTVPVGTERLRITPTPAHTPEMIDHLVEALKEVREFFTEKRSYGT